MYELTVMAGDSVVHESESDNLLSLSYRIESLRAFDKSVNRICITRQWEEEDGKSGLESTQDRRA